jgi:hypothetical protein
MHNSPTGATSPYYGNVFPRAYSITWITSEQERRTDSLGHMVTKRTQHQVVFFIRLVGIFDLSGFNKTQIDVDAVCVTLT